MRILSWNINGIRTIPQYHPWNTLKTCSAILTHLQADIICFQEMKIRRNAIDSNLALPTPFDAFFSLPTTKGGYSGVAVYTNTNTAVPLHAEQGLSSTLKQDDRIPCPFNAHELEFAPDPTGYTSTLADLDSEGRCLILDFGLFVLINLYCPNESDTDIRLVYKMNFHALLSARVDALLKAKRNVIVLGDINVIATPLDHPDGHLPSVNNPEVFYNETAHPGRKWLMQFLAETGMVDVHRVFHPSRKGMYTCWNTKINAREGNYGSRIDYIFVSKELLPWLKAADIEQGMKGSDHCPVWVELKDEFVDENGKRRVLREEMRMSGQEREPPSLAARFWDEFSGKQTRLDAFFGGGGENALKRKAMPESSSQTTQISSSQASTSQVSVSSQTTDTSPTVQPKRIKITPSSGSSTPIPSSSKPKEKTKPKPGQTTIGSFFSKPKEKEKKSSKAKETGKETSSAKLKKSKTNEIAPIDLDQNESLDEDYQFALSLSQEQDAIPTTPTPGSSQSTAAWTTLLAPLKPPLCTIHQEPAKQFTVNKPGANKGKVFFVCARPVGPGYDKGKARAREDVAWGFKCNYFKWASEVRREVS